MVYKAGVGTRPMATGDGWKATGGDSLGAQNIIVSGGSFQESMWEIECPSAEQKLQSRVERTQ